MENILGIYIISGKRHTGKDFVSLRLQKYIKEQLKKNCVFWSGSNVLKREYCEFAGLDLDKMLTDRKYKEENRAKMTAYFNNVMCKISDDYCNVKLIEDMLLVKEPTYFIFDIRYEFEIDCYVRHKLTPNILKIRINVDDDIKRRRGWSYNPKVDDDLSETCLDKYQHWNHVFENNVDGTEKIDEFIKNIIG